MLTSKPLASTTFIAGPQDDLATPDVYEIQSDAVINDLPVPSSIADVSDITEETRGGNSMLASLPSLTSINGSSSSSSSSSFLDKVKSYGSSMAKAVGGVSGIKAIAQGGGPSLLARLGNGTLNGIPGLSSGALTSLSSVLRNNNMPPEVQRLFNAPIPNTMGTYGSMGNSFVRLPSNNVNQSYQMSSLINGVMNTNSSNIVDRDSSSRLIAGLAMGGQSSGLNNSFSTLAPLAGNDQSILLNAGIAVARYSAVTGNIGGLKDVSTAIGPQNLTVIGKSLAKTFSSGYQPSSTAPQSNTTRVSDFTDLSDTLDAIDPGWMREDRMKVDIATQLPVMDFPVTDVTMVQSGTPDFKAMVQAGALKSTDPEKKWLLTGTLFDSTSPEAELAKQFPLTITSIQSNTLANTTTIASA